MRFSRGISLKKCYTMLHKNLPTTVTLVLQKTFSTRCRQSSSVSSVDSVKISSK